MTENTTLTKKSTQKTKKVRAVPAKPKQQKKILSSRIEMLDFNDIRFDHEHYQRPLNDAHVNSIVKGVNAI